MAWSGSMSARCSAATLSRSAGVHRVGSAALTAETRPGQAGSAMMASAAAEPKTLCRSVIQAGRSAVWGVSRVALEVSSADRRHQSAAAGSSSGRGWAAAAARTSVGRSGRLVAAWARRAASCGQWPSARMRGLIESMSCSKRRVCGYWVRSAAWACCSSMDWMARARTAYCGGPSRLVSSSATSWAARKTAISAASLGLAARTGLAQTGAVAGVQWWMTVSRIWSASSVTSSARAFR